MATRGPHGFSRGDHEWDACFPGFSDGCHHCLVEFLLAVEQGAVHVRDDELDGGGG